MIYSDFCGPISVESFSGCKYFTSFIDDAACFMKFRPIAQKSDALLELKHYAVWLERNYGCTIKRVHTDSGCEYVALESDMNERETEHSTSPSYFKNQKEIAERANGTIFESARSMLESTRLPRKF